MAEFPAASTNVYVTRVLPTVKRSPGASERDDNVGASPELSVAVGGVHVTAVDVEEAGAVSLISLGQPEIMGGVMSPEPDIKRKDKMGVL